MEFVIKIISCIESQSVQPLTFGYVNNFLYECFAKYFNS